MEKRFYKIEDEQTLRFYQMPKVLFTNPKYSKLSLGAKATYSILRDRQDLSIKNKWIDDDGYIYLVFDGESLGTLLQTTRQTARKYIKELEKFDLLLDKRLGQGRSNRIYVKKPDIKINDTYKLDTCEPIENTKMLSKLTSGCKDSEHQDVNKLNTNDTDFSDTDFSDTQSVEKKDGLTDPTKSKLNTIIKKAEINLYKGQSRELLENTIKKLLQLKELKIKSTVIEKQQIYKQLLKLDIHTCDYALAKFRQVQQERTIKNKSNYFMILLYTAIDEVVANNIY